MPPKFSKEVTTHLFKYVNSVEIKFNPFDRRAVSAKEIWIQLQASRFKKANKRFKILHDIHEYTDPPKVVFSFFDGTQQEVETKDETCAEILFRIHLKLSEMDALYEISGKNIDEDS